LLQNCYKIAIELYRIATGIVTVISDQYYSQLNKLIRFARVFVAVQRSDDDANPCGSLGRDDEEMRQKFRKDINVLASE